MPRVMRLGSQGKQIILNVYQYFQKMSKKTKQPTQHGFVMRTSEATGVSKRAVNRVIHEMKENAGASFISPKKRYDATRQRITTDQFDRDAIRRKNMACMKKNGT